MLCEADLAIMPSRTELGFCLIGLEALLAATNDDPSENQTNWSMLLAVRISSYGCTWEVCRALKKLELLSAAPRATLTLLSCSPNFPRASITRYTHAKHEPILNSTIQST